MPIDGITRFCFAMSYAVAFGLELLQLAWPRPAQRLAAILFATAGLLAHSLFLLTQRPSLAIPYGSLLALAWVVASFGVVGMLHYRKLAWAVFVLPVALGLVLLTWAYPAAATDHNELLGERFWGILHGTLLLLAAVGVSVGFVASVMYLVQSARLRAKTRPGSGVKLLNLERLGEMNRRAIVAAFPLLTLGLLVGVVLLSLRPAADWAATKVLSTAALWVAFLVLFYLRVATAVSPRRLAWLTVAAFVLLVLTLAAAHPALGGGAS